MYYVVCTIIESQILYILSKEDEEIKFRKIKKMYSILSHSSP